MQELILLISRDQKRRNLNEANIIIMNNARKNNRSDNEEEVKRQRMPDPQNPMVEKMDEADPLQDRSPAGDSGPEDAEKKKGPAPESTTFY
jgi:hypothetical protein